MQSSQWLLCALELEPAAERPGDLASEGYAGQGQFPHRFGAAVEVEVVGEIVPVAAGEPDPILALPLIETS